MSHKIRHLSTASYYHKKGANSRVLPLYLSIQEVVRSSYAPEMAFSVETLTYYLYKTTDRHKQKEVQELIPELDCLTKVAPNCYICNKEAFHETSFTNITVDEFHMIMESGKKNTAQLLLHFIRMMKSLDYNLNVNGVYGVVGHMTKQYFTNEYGIPERTLINYEQALEEIGVLYIKHQSSKYQNNIYGRMTDKVLIDSYCNKTPSNFHRSVSARYNRYLSNPESFSEDQLQALYADCIKYNEELPDKAKDLTKLNI